MKIQMEIFHYKIFVYCNSDLRLQKYMANNKWNHMTIKNKWNQNQFSSIKKSYVAFVELI